MINVSDRLFAANFELKALATRQPVASYVGWTGNGNLGDEALFDCIKELFRDKLFLYDRPYIGWGMSHRLRQLRAFDCTLLGGGTLLYRSRPYLDAFKNTISRRKIIFGSGMANRDFWNRMQKPIPPDWEQWTSYINQAVDYIGVRGPITARKLREEGVEKPVEIIGDPVFSLCFDRLEKKRRTKTLGVNLGRGDNLVWGGSDEKFIQNLEEVLKILAKKGWRFLFAPVWEPDIEACARVARAVANDGGEVDLQIVRRPADYLRLMNRVDVFLGEKLHSVALAACSLTPVIMMEYRPKCFEFMASLELENFNIKITDISADLVLEKLEACLFRYEDLRFQLFRKGQGYKKKLSEAAGRIQRGLIQQG